MLITLDGAPKLGKAFVLGHRFTDDPAEKWTARFNEFKSGGEKAVRAGIAIMLAALKENPPAGSKIVIGVPGSKETKIGLATPVAKLARALADSWGATFDPEMVRKNEHVPIHTHLSTAERQKVLLGAGYRTIHRYTQRQTFILIDDFLTRGDTMGCIASAIWADSPDANIWAVALAKTERKSYWQEQRGVELTNSHVEKYDEEWTRAYSI